MESRHLSISTICSTITHTEILPLRTTWTRWKGLPNKGYTHSAWGPLSSRKLTYVPIVLLVRFGNLRNNTIGTFALYAENYLCDRELNRGRPKALDLWFNIKPSANEVFDRLVARKLHVTRFARYLYAVNARIPGGEKHICLLGSRDRDQQRNQYQALSRTKPHLELSNAEIEIAKRIVADQIGVPEDAQFICFANRDNAYLRWLNQHGEQTRNSRIAVFALAKEKTLGVPSEPRQWRPRGNARP